jgi:hypothetical protein
VAIAVVIAIGTGGYAGLTSTTEWRRVSYDASYGELGMYDLRVDLASGATIDQGDLIAVATSIPSSDFITGVEERLIIATQVDASTADTTVLVRGEIIGSDFSDGGPEVNGYYPFTGRLLTEDDAGAPRVMLDRTFAKFHGLQDTGRLSVSGDRALEYVGQATTPEYFTVAPEGEMFMSEATFAGIFTTLDTAQDLAGTPGRVNNLILTLGEGADRDTVAAELEAALEAHSVGTTVLTREDNLSYSALTKDIDQDKAVFNALAFLLIAGAVGAAFNLIHRLAEQQRRGAGHPTAARQRPDRSTGCCLRRCGWRAHRQCHGCRVRGLHPAAHMGHSFPGDSVRQSRGDRADRALPRQCHTRVASGAGRPDRGHQALVPQDTSFTRPPHSGAEQHVRGHALPQLAANRTADRADHSRRGCGSDRSDGLSRHHGLGLRCG